MVVVCEDEVAALWDANDMYLGIWVGEPGGLELQRTRKSDSWRAKGWEGNPNRPETGMQ